MTQQSQPNPALAEVKELIEGTFRGGKEAVEYFAQLLNFLFSKTVVKSGSFVQVHRGPSDGFYVIAPPKRPIQQMAQASKDSEIYKPLELKNGRFLAVSYSMFSHPGDTTLKTDRSRVAYQLDDFGNEVLVRFEMARNPKNHYPFAHLHVHGNWQRNDGQKDLVKFHFPARVSIEAILRLLIHDFGIAPNTDHEIYEPLLRESESNYWKVATLQTEEPQPAPVANDP